MSEFPSPRAADHHHGGNIMARKTTYSLLRSFAGHIEFYVDCDVKRNYDGVGPTRNVHTTPCAPVGCLHASALDTTSGKCPFSSAHGNKAFAFASPAPSRSFFRAAPHFSEGGRLWEHRIVLHILQITFFGDFRRAPNPPLPDACQAPTSTLLVKAGMSADALVTIRKYNRPYANRSLPPIVFVSPRQLPSCGSGPTPRHQAVCRQDCPLRSPETFARSGGRSSATKEASY